MAFERFTTRFVTRPRMAAVIGVSCAALAWGVANQHPGTIVPQAEAQGQGELSAPPANGEMGFVVSYFVPPIVPGEEACPEGTALKVREAFLANQPAAERERLLLEENKDELERAWKLDIFAPDGSNVCAQPDKFQRPEMRSVQSSHAWGMDLDQGGGDDNCAHEEFETPTGTAGIDNQEYRALGCTLEWRGKDGQGGEFASGTRQFHLSGEWTQVILLQGVDSLVHDDDVTVIYGNTPDQPLVDSEGNILPGATFTISTETPRERNVLRGMIRNGVLTTAPSDIKLTQTWGQGGARDIRGNRGRFDFRDARLQLKFSPDGKLYGYVGGYRPLFDTILSPSLGSVGAALVAGIDCAAELAAVRKFADGLKNPKTGKCEGISTAYELRAVPAFVNDAPKARTASAR